MGVSKYTVSRALSGKSGVGHNTRLRVFEMADAMGYRTKSSTAAASPAVVNAKPSLEVVLVMQQELRRETDFWRRVLDGVIAAFRKDSLGYRFAEIADEGELQHADFGTERGNTAGFIVIGPCPRNQLFRMQSSGLPIVLVDQEESLIRAETVLNDNMTASRLACFHLFNQGCSSLAFVGRDRFSTSFQERWWGCRHAADEWKKQRHATAGSLHKWTIPYGSGTWTNALRKRLHDSCPSELPDGFVCANDRIAIALLQLLKDEGISVPERCRVVGIDNIAAAAASDPPLTTVNLAKEQLGARAVQALLRRLEFPHAVSEKIILSTELKTRTSG